jgi:uncharacterized protein with PIN domain
MCVNSSGWRRRSHGVGNRDRGGDGARCILSVRQRAGHPAQLNLGDCFAYAVAKNHRTALLFKGEDFDKTDILCALRS